MGELFNNIFEWAFKLIFAIQQLGAFLFTPLGDSVDDLQNVPQWIQTGLSYLVGILGNISPIALIGIGGVIVAIIVTIVRAFL